MRGLRFLIGLLLPVNGILAQAFAEKDFVQYTTNEGLSHNLVSALTQDSLGYLWIATGAGLNRYDGRKFVQYHSTDNENALPAEELNGLSWLSGQRMAVRTTGIHIRNTATGVNRNVFVPFRNTQFEYKFNMVERVSGDDEGNLFVLSRSGFYQFDSSYRLVFRFDYYTDSQIPSDHFFFGRELLTLDANRFVIVAIDGIYLYRKKEKIFGRMKPADCPPLSRFLDYPASYYSFHQPAPGQLMVLKQNCDTLFYVDVARNSLVASHLPFNPGYDEFHYRSRLIPVNDTLLFLTSHHAGFYKLRFFPETGQVKMDPEKFFPRYQCRDLLVDKWGLLWVATNKGLFHETAAGSRVEAFYLSAGLLDSFPSIRLDDIFIAGEKLFAGSRTNGGLLIYDHPSMRFHKQVQIKFKNPDNSNVNAIVPVGVHSVLMGTELALYDHRSGNTRRLNLPQWQEGDWAHDLYRDRKGNIWISAYHLYKYQPDTREVSVIPYPGGLLKYPAAFAEDGNGNIWLAGHGLARFNTQANRFDLQVDSFPFIKMMDKQINGLVIDKQERLWFNSNNNGLICYNPGTREFMHFTRNDGLPENNISSMILVGETLWMACYGSLASMDLRSYQIRSFGSQEGVPKMEVVRGARFYYDSSRGQLYIGYNHAILRFNPHSLLRKRMAPELFVESLLINGRKRFFQPRQKITSSWKQNDIVVSIGSIGFSDGAGQAFAFRMAKDPETPWQVIGEQNSFSISNLSPGTHHIQVKVFSRNQTWPEQIREIEMEILPPFWKTEWFLVLAAIAGLTTLYLLIKWRTTVARKKEMEQTHLERLKAEDYRNQFELEQISNYFSSSMAGKKTASDVLWDVAQHLIGRMNYVDCMIYLWSEDKTRMVQKAAYGPKGSPESIASQLFDVTEGQGVVGYVMKTRQPILIPDTRLDPRYRIDEKFRLSEVCVPIIHGEELLGIIDCEHDQLNYFKERDLKILTTIATLIGNKLKQLESEQSLEAKQEELATINQQLAAARLSALQAQMNPHFTFNALNSIKRMILDGDADKASRYLSKFALMIRMTLNHSKETFVSLAENIEYLESYLEMEKLRFDGVFQYTIHTDDDIDTSDTFIPSLMLQPLVENAIWHGLMPGGANKKIRIGFYQEKGCISCVIEDNGIGFAKSEKLKANRKNGHRSQGLENILHRINIINEKFDANCSLTLTDIGQEENSRTGTRVVLKLSILNLS